MFAGLVSWLQTEQGTGATAVPSIPPRPIAANCCITATTADSYSLPIDDDDTPSISKHRVGHQPSPRYESSKQAARKRQRQARR